MSAFIPVIWAGILSAAVMAFFLVEVEKFGWAKSDMFWTIGSLFSKSKRKARIIGLSVHSVAGILFATLYVAIWSIFTPMEYNEFLKIGLLTGVMHGVAVAFSQIILLAGRERGFNVALAQVAAHSVFGLVLGAIVGLLESRYESVTGIAQIVARTTGVGF